MPKLSSEQLRKTGVLLFEKAGAPREIAARVVDSLVASNLAGHDSHGIAQAPGYIKKILDGGMNAKAVPVVVNESPTTALVDARLGFGKIAADLAVDLLIAKTLASKVAAVGIRNCFHIGRLGQYAERAIEKNVIAMITLCGGGAGTSTTPYGGAGKTLGTNPFAFGIPAGRETPLIVDFATTQVAGGKIAVARDKGQRIPEGWVVKKDGTPTTDPNDFYQGGMLTTMGQHKGFGLSMVAEALGGALTGSTWFKKDDNPGNNVFLWGVATDAFLPAGEYAQREDASIAKIRATPPAVGFTEVLVPGDPERRTRAERERSGIEIPEQTLKEIRAIAEKLGVAAEVDKVLS
jgi:LDH2 family malate/lactate/ureidoglycolate dehydrogenase